MVLWALTQSSANIWTTDIGMSASDINIFSDNDANVMGLNWIKLSTKPIVLVPIIHMLPFGCNIWIMAISTVGSTSVSIRHAEIKFDTYNVCKTL